VEPGDATIQRDPTPLTSTKPAPSWLHNALYVMCTSGSSGQPSAVVGSECATLARLRWMWDEVPFAVQGVDGSGGGGGPVGDLLLFRTPVSFVDCWWELLGGLLAGVPTLVRPALITCLPFASTRQRWSLG
jgi:non-ribosomal peptide synthetase component F